MELDEEAVTALRFRAKTALRKRARALRSTIPAAQIAARSARIVERLAALPAITNARSVAIFDPILGRNEVDLRPLAAILRERGVRVAYPAIDPDSRVMFFTFVDDEGALVERGLGFREPPPDSPDAGALDVIVVPALQVDPLGHRIGYGAGFYDMTLPRYAPPAVTIAVVFEFQMIPEVPVTEGDFAVGLIVTDETLREAEPSLHG